jgi:hypothetical protein
MLTNLRLADLRQTTAQQRFTGQSLPSDLYCGPSSAKQRNEELRTPITGLLGFIVVLTIAEASTGDELTRFFLTTNTKSRSEEFSPVAVDDSGRKFLAGAVAPGI